MGARGVSDTYKAWLPKSAKQGLWGLTETELKIMVPAWVCTRASASMLWLLAWCFGGDS